MRVFDILRLLVPELEPIKTKIHLAGWNGFNDPLDVFLAGRFAEWQSYQSQRNFERPLVLSLIKLKERDRWLFAGLHRVDGPCERVANPIKTEPDCFSPAFSQTR
jgi:hypothetical protein